MNQLPDEDEPTVRAFTIEDRDADCFARLHIEIEIPEEDEPEPGSEADVA
jgi:hypothetical protein